MPLLSTHQTLRWFDELVSVKDKPAYRLDEVGSEKVVKKWWGDKLMKKIIVIISIFVAAGAAYWYFFQVLSDHKQIDRQDSSTTSEEPIIEEEPEVVQAPTKTETSVEAKPTSSVVALACENCWLAPVDKQHALAPTYAPSVRALNAGGGGNLTAEAAGKLEDLFAAATADSVAPYVKSSYRSYQTQVSTFESWVAVEMANGYARAEAEDRANTYSARPGHSEHQLGTTLDILCAGCGFDFNSANQEIWDWLADNAEDYGFVVSYPLGRDDETGYTHEPWHYRYIGVDNAAVFNAQSKLTLNKWLEAR